ncbi:hypothetical protein MiSe_08860 [Microseira wollei NIES-4236]|uniref:Uncharacterized protein n=1 Tax=Microseira wollei NIES-4236 TaxID=2530354 RepID=A0AAV3X2G9_9CYAN|nr:hypothetical protein MiSe_08860 [Microseira wollei NIES-4236]
MKSAKMATSRRVFYLYFLMRDCIFLSLYPNLRLDVLALN